jgi:Fe-S cluster assembly iron-binding protein IscA
MSLSISHGPQDGDEIIETGGVRVFLQTDAAGMLDGKALDAHIDGEGVAFEIGLPPE